MPPKNIRPNPLLILQQYQALEWGIPTTTTENATKGIMLMQGDFDWTVCNRKNIRFNYIN